MKSTEESKSNRSIPSVTLITSYLPLTDDAGTMTEIAHKSMNTFKLAPVILQTLKLGCLGALALTLAACATPQSQPEASAEDPLSPMLTRPDGSIRGDTDDQRVAELWAAAEQARLQDKKQTALNLLYDALEISPQNPVLWSRAAEIQLDNLQAALAESYAAKSNAFANNNRALLRRNWMIIELSRDLRGDLLGVRSAHKKVQEYQYQ